MMKLTRYFFVIIFITTTVWMAGCSSEQKTQSSEDTTPQQAVSEAPTVQPAQEAQRKLTFAQNNMKMAQRGILGYQQVVAICRGIIQDYPDTEYAQQARELLRQIPEDKRAQFNLTEAELGSE
mgnify:CR=1 FL=1